VLVAHRRMRDPQFRHQQMDGLRAPHVTPINALVPGRAPVHNSVWDRLASTYGLAGPDHFSAFAGRLVELLPFDPGAAVLDLACGAGAVASAVALAAPSVTIVAVDLSVEVLRRAALEVLRPGAGCAVAAMDAQLLAFADRAFGTVMCGSALDSLPDPGRALAEAHRVLRRGGTLGLWVAPSWWWQGDPRWNWHDDLLVSLGADVGQVPADLDGPASLRQMIQSIGFQDVCVRMDEFGLRFKDAHEWWQWLWSHGFRQVMERLPADQISIYRRTAFEYIGHDGIEGRMQALIATAVRYEY
jgi:ubiquinone/menaquinone biosynthesis C-methylase UbiE